MGVYFERMNMPTNCDLCPLHVRYTTEIACRITGSRYAVSGIPFASYKMRDCPAHNIFISYEELKEREWK